MKTYNILLLSLVFLASYGLPSYGKFDSKPPIKWGQVNDFEIQLKKYDESPDAPAVILCDYGDIEITNRAMITRHVRIKILSKDGLNYIHFQIPYVYKNDYDDITKLKAQVINIDKKGNLKINKLANFEFTKEIIDDEKALMSFTFSDGVEVGSILEFQYEVASLNVISFDDWFFQNELPTLWSEIRFDTPEQFTYLMTYKKGNELNPTEKLEFENQLNWLRSTKTKKALRELYSSNNILYQTRDKRFVSYVINERKKKIVHKDIPAFPTDKPLYLSKDGSPKISLHLFESHGLNHPIYKPVVMAMDENYENISKTRVWYERNPVGYIHYKLPTWDTFNDNYLNNERFGIQLIKHVDYITILDDIVSQDLSSEDKAINIYAKLKSSVRWNGNYNTFTSTDLNKVVKNEEGNSADLNLLLTYLFRRSGLNAYPVLVKSKYDGVLETSYPAHNQFNHVIVAVQDISGKILLFDMTAPNNNVPYSEIYQKGWAVKKNDYGWLDFTNTKTYSDEKSLVELL